MRVPAPNSSTSSATTGVRARKEAQRSADIPVRKYLIALFN